MNAKWTSDMTIKFVHEYKNQECLWNYMSPGFKSKRAREAAYQHIANVMNLPDFGPHEVKNKIKNLRSTYCQEIKKMEDSKTGVHIYESNIKWLKDLAPTIQNKAEFKRQAKAIKVTIEEENQGKPFNERDDCHKTTIIQKRPIMNTALTTPPPVKRLKEDSINTANDTVKKTININERDESDIFGESVAIQLKKMSEEKALLAKCKIQAILTEYGIADLKEKRCPSSRSHRVFSSLPSASPREIYAQHSNSNHASSIADNNSSDPLGTQPFFFNAQSVAESYEIDESDDNKADLEAMIAENSLDE